tara:strand:+ start:7407 stop:7883 length:477 start_codon:yes stop_codon:yes gene_type:complete
MKVAPLIASFLPLILAVIVLLRIPVEPVYIEVPVPYMVEGPNTSGVDTAPQNRSPEFRQPPLKQWRPKQYQQMGLLSNGTDTLPLYGKESASHRDRFFYYTTTPGEQIFPLPITHNGRDCMDDIGCPEFYGNENVTVTDREGAYTTKIYRTEQFQDLM